MLRLFNVIAILALLITLIGYFRGWFEISKPGSDEYAVTLDRDRIDEDTKAARELASKLGNRIAGRRISGDVKYVNPLTLSLVITDGDGEEHTFRISGQSRITRDGETAGLFDLADMSRVAVTFEEVDGERRIEEIEILD